MLPWRVWAFSTYRVVGVSARKRVLSWAVSVRIMLKLWKCSLAMPLSASPTAILAVHISLNNVINGVSNLLERGCVGVLPFTQVLEPRNPTGCLRPCLSKAVLAAMIFNVSSLITAPFLQTSGIFAAWESQRTYDGEAVSVQDMPIGVVDRRRDGWIFKGDPYWPWLDSMTLEVLSGPNGPIIHCPYPTASWTAEIQQSSGPFRGLHAQLWPGGVE